MNFQFAKEVHHPVKKKFERRKVVVTGIDEIWAMDLASMESFVEYNKGYKFILCIIDVFSKYAWCVPLKNKAGITILDEVKNITIVDDRIPQKIWVDRGSEFYNKEFQKWANHNKITIYSTYGESKSVVVERFIRTLKQLITKYFTATNSRDWVSILPTVVDEYNNHIHSTIGMTPVEASDPENSVEVFNNIQHKPKKKTKKNNKNQFKIGDLVRISRTKGTFEKGYEANWTYEVFTVSKVLDTPYKLIDYHKDPVEGSFYKEEMIKTGIFC